MMLLLPLALPLVVFSTVIAAQNTIDPFSGVFDFYTFEDYYLNPQPPFQESMIDIRAELARIGNASDLYDLRLDWTMDILLFPDVPYTRWLAVDGVQNVYVSPDAAKLLEQIGTNFTSYFDALKFDWRRLAGVKHSLVTIPMLWTSLLLFTDGPSLRTTAVQRVGPVGLIGLLMLQPLRSCYKLEDYAGEKEAWRHYRRLTETSYRTAFAISTKPSQSLWGTCQHQVIHFTRPEDWHFVRRKLRDDEGFQNGTVKATNTSKSKGVSQLIIDVTNNGGGNSNPAGGSVSLGLWLHQFLAGSANGFHSSSPVNLLAQKIVKADIARGITPK
ncbi:hypothetical protein BU17DRAFT_72118 [Hysterangium stoloniferum]|nr:hypothetical protein BU17DRAFT_72118 [Hysterangium stoloniferum]